MMGGVTCPSAVAQSQSGSVCRPGIRLASSLGGASSGCRPAAPVKPGSMRRSRPRIDVPHSCEARLICRLSERAGDHLPLVSGSRSRRRWRWIRRGQDESRAEVATVAVFPTVGGLLRRHACANDHRLPRVTAAAFRPDVVQYEHDNQGENQWGPDRDQFCHRSALGDDREASGDGEGSGGGDGVMGGLWSSGSGLEKEERWRGGRRRAVALGAVVGVLALWCFDFGAQRELMWAKAEEEEEEELGRRDEEGSAGTPGSGPGLAATTTSFPTADRRDPADSELVRRLLERSRANKAKYDKERLDDYYRRNYLDYFKYIEGSIKRKKELTSTETGILKWLEENR
ncbi:hypothetical protein CBR_g6736 [Chara braunii]|uniref:Uncharacterized protein n=1 Tax=Chara braunii TaxID=69332 RepID=A0A388KKM9_CHABU|nr:hypothetical protein CBR_g6736 [Chara braunii]|eukprot:GBG70609.1 hypothetical protein CBR_g6736 [Chara braunii]